MRVDAVAEGAGALVREKAVLALPARPVGRVERVDVEVAAEAVERLPRRGRVEAVDRRAPVGVRAEEVVPPVPGPVHLDREHRQVRSSSARAAAPRLPGSRSGRDRSSEAAAASSAPPSSCRRAPCTRSRTTRAPGPCTSGTSRRTSVAVLPGEGRLRGELLDGRRASGTSRHSASASGTRTGASSPPDRRRSTSSSRRRSRDGAPPERASAVGAMASTAPHASTRLILPAFR